MYHKYSWSFSWRIPFNTLRLERLEATVLRFEATVVRLEKLEATVLQLEATAVRLEATLAGQHTQEDSQHEIIRIYSDIQADLQPQDALPPAAVTLQVTELSSLDDIMQPDAMADTYDHTTYANLNPLMLAPNITLAGLTERLCLLHYPFLSIFYILRWLWFDRN